MRKTLLGIALMSAQFFCVSSMLADGNFTPVPLDSVSNRDLVDDTPEGDGKGGWSDQGRDNCLNQFPRGKITLKDIPFQIPEKGNAAIMFKGLKLANLPNIAKDVAIKVPAGAKGSNFYMLACFGWLHEGEVRRRMARLAESEGLMYDSMAVGWLPKTEGRFPTLTAALIAQIEAASPGLYRHVVHLGQDLPDMKGLRIRGDAKSVAGSVARDRDAEFKLCTDPELISYAASHDVEFIRFSDLTPAERYWFTHGTNP